MIYVIIPVYNGSKYLKRCLDSVCKQTYKNIRVICVNDGSTDNSLEILNEYKHITILSKENGGLSSARNYGIDSIVNFNENDWISFIDCDDYVDEDYFEKLINLADSSGADIVCSSFYITSNANEKKHTNIEKESLFSSFEATSILIEDKSLQSHAWSKLYKLNLFESIRYPENVKFMEDQCTTYKVFCLAKTIYVSNYCGYHYWISDTSLIRSNPSSQKMLSALNSYYSVCIYDFNFEEAENKILVSKANDALADCYLMIKSKISKKKLTKGELNSYLSILAYIKKNKIVRNYHPTRKTSMKKRFAYLYFRPFYNLLYKLFG